MTDHRLFTDGVDVVDVDTKFNGDRHCTQYTYATLVSPQFAREIVPVGHTLIYRDTGISLQYELGPFSRFDKTIRLVRDTDRQTPTHT